ncbi:MAG: hypothetical protein ACRDWT_11735 [Jatrophihabitantaceae bacterium]
MITDPRFAPRRTDLPYLRRRRLPRAVGEPQPAVPSAAPAAAGTISFDRPDRRRTASTPPAPPAPSTPAAGGSAGSKISFDRPDRRSSSPQPVPAASSSLDLDSPATRPPAPAAPTSPAPRPTPVGAPAASSSSLDLDEPAPPAAAQPSAPPAEPPRRVRDDVRVRAGARKILTVTAPTVTLTRLQSAIGTLRVEGACSDEVGDLRIGCAYQLRSGESSTVQLTGGNRLAPAGSRRPVIIASHEQFGLISVDLRQSVALERMAIYAFSETRAPLRWGGTLIAETFGGARIELPLESLRGGDVAMLMSLYNVRGEFVLRAEMQSLNGGVREACRAYGYDRITWLDDRTPVD